VSDGNTDWDALLDTDSSEVRETEGTTDTDAKLVCVP